MSLPLRLIERLFYFAATTSDAKAIESHNINLTYGELARVILSESESLSESGIDHSSVVGIECSDEIEHLVICLSLIYMGASGGASLWIDRALWNDASGSAYNYQYKSLIRYFGH